MSIAANLPPRAKRLSLRIADLGVPIPPRVQQFLDGPEVEALDGARAWGLEGWSGDTKLKVRWASGRLHDILHYATEVGFEGARERYLPIAALGSESHMFVVDVTDPKLAVFFFDHESGFKKWADDFDSFLLKLLRRGEKTPSEKLEKAHEAATAANEAKDYPTVIATLAPVFARFPKVLPYEDDDHETLGAAYNLMGIAYEKTKDLVKASTYYELGLENGSDSAGLNLCDLLLDHHKDYEKLVEFGEKRRESIYRFSDGYAWFHIRNYLGQGYLLTGRPRDAIRAYHQISSYALDDPDKVKEAVADLRKLRDERPEADRETIATILVWLDVPAPHLPPDKLATLKAWWPGVPGKVKDAIKESLKLEGEPSDTDLARIARITDLDVEDGELSDLSWVTQLEHLDDLDIENNDLVDLSPLATLPVLTRLDISNNKITSLRPLAKLTRLERLVADENPLTGLEGLEQLHDLTDLHITESGLTTLEPLRGLRGLEDVTVYNNQIADLSPLADCPRLKEISSFGNPIARGLAALGKLPWLETVDTGDDTAPADAKALRAANAFVEIEHYYPDDDNDKVDVDTTPDPTLRDWWTALPKPWKKAFDSELNREARNKDLPPDEDLLKLVREDHISIENTPLPDLEPMRRFQRADYLNFTNTGIADLAPLSRLPRLRDLVVRDNRIDLVSLAPAEKLEELYMERCQVTSLIGLERCRGLRKLLAEDNHVDDLRPLAELTELRELDLEGNRVTDLAVVAKLEKLRVLKLGLTRIVDLSPLASCRALRELEVWGEHAGVLRNALALAELPDLVSVISHGAIPSADIDALRARRPKLVID